MPGGMMTRLKAFLWRGLFAWMSARGLPQREVAARARQSDQFDTALFDRADLKFLHVGCGAARKPAVGPGFLADEWREIRLDIDPAADPDIMSSMLDMAAVPSASVDAVYSSHNIEHLYPHEVPVALAEFFRVLKPAGLLVLTCPDLQSLCRLVADDKLDEPAYLSAVGPIAPIDVLYGHRPPMAAGNLYMAHRTGFTLKTLVAAVRAAGFPSVAGKNREACFDLWLVASKSPLHEKEILRLAETHFPR